MTADRSKDIRVGSDTVYYAPSARRRYLSARAAAVAEARARIRAKYPSEPCERDEIGITYSGWDFTEDERLVKVHARLSRMLLRRFRLNNGVFS